MPMLSLSSAMFGAPAQYSDYGDLATGTFDLGAVPNSAPTLTITYTGDVATSVTTLSSRSSSDGVTWSAWAIASGNELQSTLARFWQVQVRLSTTDTTKTPTLTGLQILATYTPDEVIDAGWEWNHGGIYA